MEQKTIWVYTENKYGRENVYVAEIEMARTITQLTGTRTLTQNHIDALKELGFKVEGIIRRRVF